MNIIELTKDYAPYILIGTAGVCLVLLVLLIIVMCKQAKLKKRYEKFLMGKDAQSLEEKFTQGFQHIEELREKSKVVDNRLAIIEDTLQKTYQKVGIVKYDAFNEMGGKLSFALAMLTNQNNGFVMTSMHSSREGCFTYIKEIKNGTCDIILSEEEAQALEMAMNGSRE